MQKALPTHVLQKTLPDSNSVLHLPIAASRAIEKILARKNFLRRSSMTKLRRLLKSPSGQHGHYQYNGRYTLWPMEACNVHQMSELAE